MELEPVRPDLLVAERPRRAARWFGLPFALAGCLPLAGAFGLVHIEGQSGGDAPSWFLIPFGLLFVGVGLGMILFRTGFTIDLAAGTITRWHRVLLPLRRRTRSIEAFRGVVHFKEVVRSDKSTRIVYPVELTAGAGRGFRLVVCSDFPSARRAAENVGKALGLPVIDRTDGTERRREADELDLSLREKRRRHRDVPELTDAPPDMRSRVVPDGGAIEIEVPGFGMTPFHYLGLALATGPVWLVAAFLFAAQREVPGFFVAVAFAMGVLPAVVATTAIVAHARRSWHVRVSSRELRVETRGLRGSVTTIPAEQLEELVLPDESRPGGMGKFLGGGPPITAISDHAYVRFGQSLRLVESRYLAQVIRGVISAPAR